MKRCLFFRSVAGLWCVMLLGTRLALARPPAAKPINCTDDSNLNSDDQEQRISVPDPDATHVEDPAAVKEHAFPSPSLINAQRYASPKSTNDYLSALGSDYFDYYYEDSDEPFDEDLLGSLSNVTRLSGDEGPVVQHQPPSGLHNRVTKLKLVKTLRRRPPEYMLDLYDRLTKAGAPVTTQPTAREANNDNSDFGAADIVRSFPNINKEDENDTTSEKSYSAELHDQALHGDETRHHILAFNISSLKIEEEVSRAELRLYTLVKEDRNKYDGDDRLVSVYDGIHTRHQPPIVSRSIQGQTAGWEAFDVTSVVRTWVSKGSRSGDGIHVVKVAIASKMFKKGGPSNVTIMDIDVDPEHNEGPILLVFSRDTSRRESQNVIRHESDERTMSKSSEKVPANNDHYIIKRRTLRDADMSSSAKELFLSAELSRTSRTDVPRQRVRRSNRRRSSCHRKPMYVDFQDVNWNHLMVLAPPGYMAFECVGRCNYPIDGHLSPTNHAVIQTMVHAAYPKRASSACCVPTKLEPISMLYVEGNVVTFQFEYRDMVVTACGCR